MKRYVPAVIWMVMGFLWSSSLAAQNANEIVGKASALYENANGLSVNFALHYRDASGQSSESFEGVIQMKGDKFTLVTPDIRVWFDGKTQWTYRSDEVNITEPTGDELESTNPTLLLKNYKKGYKAVFKGESTAPSGKTAYDVELTPKKKGDITKVSLQIEKNTSQPARISIESKNGSKTTIQIDKLVTGLNQSDAFFVFNNKDYPEAEIIDLRE